MIVNQVSIGNDPCIGMHIIQKLVSEVLHVATYVWMPCFGYGSIDLYTVCHSSWASVSNGCLARTRVCVNRDTLIHLEKSVPF